MKSAPLPRDATSHQNSLITRFISIQLCRSISPESARENHFYKTRTLLHLFRDKQHISGKDKNMRFVIVNWHATKLPIIPIASDVKIKLFDCDGPVCMELLPKDMWCGRYMHSTQRSVV